MGSAASGFIYHPRLAVFNAGIKFTDNRQLAHVGGKRNTQTWGYDVLLTFLPYRPVSLDALMRGTLIIPSTPTEILSMPSLSRSQNVNYTYYGARFENSEKSLSVHETGVSA